MKHVCSEDMKGFDQLLSLPPEDAERAAVEACPRCGSRFLAFQAFLRAQDVAGADPEEAEKRLTELVQGLTADLVGEPANGRPGFWERFRRSMVGPRVLVPAMAAALLIALGVLRWHPWVDDSPGLRSNSADVQTVVLLSATAVSDGALDVSWEPVALADAYAVRLLRADLTEIRRVGPIVDTSAHIDTAAARSEGGVYWQLVALQNGDEIAASAIREFSPPASR
jgi:hypothetical protein